MKARWSTPLLLGVAVAAFAVAGRMHRPLRSQRREAQLDPVDPVESMPPLVAFTTVAFGGFRGIAADLLWLRATTLQDEGRYFELVQLADWITKLQPHFASVWAYHAWNMAYNISVLLDDHGDRWRWVRHGISLLRDEGLRYNPGSAQLHRELAWLFIHKVGGDMDEAHWRYKREWAAEMGALFEGPAPDFEALAAAPRTRTELLEEAAVAELVRRLREAGVDPFGARIADPAARPAAAAPILAGAPEAAAALLDFVRARRLREEYRMTPEAMAEVDERYGPLDWRLPQAHAIFWAYQGLRYARPGHERLSLDRMIFQSMVDAFLRGRLTADAERDVFLLRPNPDLLHRVRAAYEDALAEHPGDESIRTAHHNFLVDAVMVAFSYNRRREAQALYADLVARYPTERTLGGLDRFVARTYAEFMERFAPREAMVVVESAFYQSFFWEALGEPDQAAGYAQLGRLMWERFMAEREDPEARERLGLPPIAEIRARARERALETVRELRGAADAPTPAPR